MKVLSIETVPIAEIPFANARSGGRGAELCRLPVLRGVVDALPEGTDALVLTADLQGREERGRFVADAALLGEIVPGKLAEILPRNGLPHPRDCGAILAGDLFTVPLLTRRGGTGDVTPVWNAFADAFWWVAGVAGNHDLFGTSPRPSTDLQKRNRVHLLDSTVAEIDGLRIGGVFGAIGNPRRPNSLDPQIYDAQLIHVLARNPSILVLHDGPDADGGLLGRESIRSRLEAGPPGDLGLVVRGHAYWPAPLATLSSGIQVLNVDGRVVVLTRVPR